MASTRLMQRGTRTILATALAVGSLAVSLAPATVAGAAPPPGSTWNLAFADEFATTALDKSKWHTCHWWSTTTCSIETNKELELYTPNNVYVADGALKLQARKENAVAWNGSTYNYTSGMVSTGGRKGQIAPGFVFTYGYVEARVKVPKGQGLWPALWLLPNSHAWPPEIDIMEIRGHETTVQQMHYLYPRPDGTYANIGTSWAGPDFSADWHTFGVDWSPQAIIWYVDGVERARFSDVANITSEPSYVLLNLAVGGSWLGAPDATTPFPSEYLVDYVRVWQRGTPTTTVGLGTITVDDVSVGEGDSGTKPATFTITRGGPAGAAASVVWATANNSAGAGTDYVAVPPTSIVFAPGETTKTVSVTVKGDVLGELDESFFVKLSAPVGATIADGSALGTIVNDDTSVAVNDVTVSEGNAGTKTATFTVTRAGALGATSSVVWATADNSAKAGTDYVAVAPTTLTFTAGQTTKSVSVTVNGDTQGEPNESFFVKLSSPTGTKVADASGLGLITNDDTAFAVNDVTVTEGNSATTTATFTIARSGPTTGTSTVAWATADNSAQAAGSDYTGVAPTTVTFAPGVTTKTVSVTIRGDSTVEPNETFFLKLDNPTGATILDGSGLGVITNDD